MQHVTAVKIGGGGGRHYIMRFYYMAWSGCDLYSGNIKYYCSYYQFDQIQDTCMSHIQYLQFTTIQYNSTSFLSNIEHNYITVIVEVVCLNMFFYDWSNIKN